MVKVSVLVPCCNVEKYVEECLQSIKRQSLQDIEVICINDGSTDQTLNIIKECIQGDERFIVIDKPNSGYGDSMNLGLRLAKGEYIGIVESDDFIEPNMFELLYAKAKEFNLDVSRACYFHLREGKDIPDLCPRLLKNQVVSPREHTDMFFQAPSIWTAIYKTSWLRSSKIDFLSTPGAAFQDTSFAFKVNLMANRFMTIENCLLHYRLHDTNSVKSSKNIFSVCEEYAECIRYAKEKGLYKSVKNILIAMQYATYRWNYLRLEQNAAHDFYCHWVKEWRFLRKEDAECIKSLPFSRRLHFRIMIHFPSMFEWYLKHKRKN